MNEDYSVPFFVGRNNKRFCGVDAFGYLPPLEPPEPIEEKPVIKFLIKDDVESLKAEILQLKSMVLYLQNKLNEHLDKKKRGKY